MPSDQRKKGRLDVRSTVYRKEKTKITCGKAAGITNQKRADDCAYIPNMFGSKKHSHSCGSYGDCAIRTLK